MLSMQSMSRGIIIGTLATMFAGESLGLLNKSYSPRLTIPKRSAQAMGGKKFLNATFKMKANSREQAILGQIRKGNIPNSLRNLKEIKVQGYAKNGTLIKASFWVLPNYLSIGSDRDSVLIPMNLYTANQIAREFGFILPTPLMVDKIYEQSQVRLNPRPMKPGPHMTSNSYYRSHNMTISRQIGGTKGKLIAGHKKDVVISKVLGKRNNRIAIYGWHRLSGEPIQPLSTAHHSAYADYSHGIRLVSNKVKINGKLYYFKDVLKSPQIAGLFSSEGPLNINKLMRKALTAH
ncbi:MAG: hypothetical protein CMP10_16070 [Zetaproteobacteria bacterium]|nr:hypothetical protein [Pseudobdellovibrionaceae bacterium]